MGLALFQMGNFAAASSELKTALQLNPHDRNARLGLARGLMEAGNLKGALALLDQLQQEDPKDAEAHFTLAMVHTKLAEAAPAPRLDVRSAGTVDFEGDLGSRRLSLVGGAEGAAAGGHALDSPALLAERRDRAPDAADQSARHRPGVARGETPAAAKALWPHQAPRTAEASHPAQDRSLGRAGVRDFTEIDLVSHSGASAAGAQSREMNRNQHKFA
jgi:tetratricopeptide (TPR) repeat protein